MGKASKSVGNIGGEGNGKTSKPTWFSRRLHGDSHDSKFEVSKESEINIDEGEVSKTLNESVFDGSSCGNTGTRNDVIVYPSEVTGISKLLVRVLSLGVRLLSVSIMKMVSFAEAVDAAAKMDTAACTHTAKGDNATPSHDTLIVQSVSIQKPVSCTGAAVQIASTPIKGKANFHFMAPGKVCEGVDFTIPIMVVDEISTRFENTLYGYFIGKRLAFPVDVLKSGSWMIRNIPIILKNWTMDTRLLKEELTLVPVFKRKRFVLSTSGRHFVVIYAKYFVHDHDQCLKIIKVTLFVEKINDGFQTVVNKRKSSKKGAYNNFGNHNGVKIGGQPVKLNFQYVPKSSVSIPQKGDSNVRNSLKSDSFKSSKASDIPSSSNESPKNGLAKMEVPIPRLPSQIGVLPRLDLSRCLSSFRA
ncbi:hypothetical protein Tco_0865876 [Tanacetum coccineum]